MKHPLLWRYISLFFVAASLLIEVVAALVLTLFRRQKLLMTEHP